MAEAFYGPRSRENARLLLDAAKALDIHPREVRTQVGGYLVPEKIVDYINGEAPEAPESDAESQGAAESTEVSDSGTQEQEAPVKRPSVPDAKADWLEYAQHIDLDVTDDNTKAEIIEAVKKAEEATD